MAAKKKRTGIEWVGGLVSMPAYVSGEGDPYRPEALLWMGEGGLILGHTMGKPGELLGLASASLRSTMERPMIGRPRAPGRVRVASPALAEALRTGHTGIEVVCAPTPEIDAVLAAMRESVARGAEAEETYLTPGVSPAALAALFRAAAALFRAQPWKTLPCDQDLFSVTIEKLGVTEAVLSVIGQMGESLGLVLFSSIDDFDVYLDAADALERGEEPTIPRHFALNFERGAELSAGVRKEIAEHSWEVAGANAYPWLGVVDEDCVARPPTAEEVTIAEAIALALPGVLEEKDALLAAWDGGEAVARTLRVSTHAGDVEVSIRVPYDDERVRCEVPYDVLTSLFELEQDGDEIDADARRRLEDELMQLFEASPEAKALSDTESCRWVMDFAADYFGATVATLDPRELREIVFDIIPRKVSIEASAARSIIEQNRALFAFLERVFALEQAGACLRVLGGAAVKKLEAALSDTSRFGLAKSLFMAGQEAGFEMSSKEDIEAWMGVLQSQPLPASVRLPPLDFEPGFRPTDRPAVRTNAARAKKKSRKSARRARRKNR